VKTAAPMPYGAVCLLAASLILLFTDFKMSETATVIYSLVIYFLYETFYTVVGIPYNSMGSLATNRDSDRRSINVYRNLGAGLGGVIGAVVCLPLLRLFGGLDEKGNLIDATSAHGFFLTACLRDASSLPDVLHITLLQENG
jgi:GPH family glycoside/pentoside/hexuronide:cation symporter